jgi:hypothetical protein
MHEQKKSSGCWKVAILVGVLLLIGVLAMALLPALWFSRAKEQRLAEVRMIEAREAQDRRGVVVFREGAIPAYEPHRRGEELTREQFVALMIDDFATELAREEFQKTSNGEQVSWLLRAEDISGNDGALHGDFTLPYEIVSDNRGRGSAVNVRCEFLPEHKDTLLKVRRQEWVTVEGKLSFDGRKASISEARIVEDEAPRRAGQPERGRPRTD